MDQITAVTALRRYSGLASKQYPGMRGGSVHSQQYDRPPRRWQVNLHIDDKSGSGGHRAQVVVWFGTDGSVHVEAESRRCARTGYRLAASPDLLAWGERVAAAVRRDLGEPAAAPRPQTKADARAAEQAAADQRMADFLDMFGGAK